MANPILFRRTNATRQRIIMDPINLPDSQKFVFSAADDIVDKLEREYRNKITRKPAPTIDGTRLIKVTDNGIDDLVFTMGGYFSMDNADLNRKFINWPQMRQVETAFHLFGIFGLIFPNYTNWGFDPDNTAGLTINSISSVLNFEAKHVEFILTLGVGGNITQLP